MIILCVSSLSGWKQLLDAPADALVFGLEQASSRSQALLKKEELSEISRTVHQAGKKFFLNFQALIEQDQTVRARHLLEEAVRADADGIYMADEGYLTIAQELEQKLGIPVLSRCIYQPETLICSGEDARFYIDQGLQAVSLANELSADELAACARSCSELEVLCAGHSCWMESRRGLLENYFRKIGSPESFTKGELYNLRETQRPAMIPVWQDDLGTHILSPDPVQAGAAILDLKKAGINRFRIDGLNKTNEWAAEMACLYANALSQNSSTSSSLPPSTFQKEQSLIRKGKEV